MEWIESSGGPLVVAPESFKGAWRGMGGDQDEDQSDYDRACNVTDELAILQAGSVEVLVLGDEPLRTTWVPSGRGGLLVRWVYADDERSILEFLAEGNLDQEMRKTDIRLTVPGPCMLFDAADAGDDLSEPSLRLDLLPGTYTLETALVDPSREVRLLIHRLTLRG